MMLRARHVVLAWLACGTLQLVLFGVGGGVATRTRIGDRVTRAAAAWPAVSFAKRYLAVEPNDRRAPITAFAPVALLRFERRRLGTDAAHHHVGVPRSHHAVAFPIARAPPTRS